MVKPKYIIGKPTALWDGLYTVTEWKRVNEIIAKAIGRAERK